MVKPVLVNRANPIPRGYLESLDIVEIAVEPDFFVPLEREAADKYLQLKSHLASIGIRVELLSGLRSQKTQERIWNEAVATYGEGYAEQYVAKPGYSEHQTGLALDLTLYDAGETKLQTTTSGHTKSCFPICTSSASSCATLRRKRT